MSKATIAARIVFAAVFAINVACAVGFVVAPGDYAGAYQLDGVPGEAAVRGIGVAFLMWNATYPLFVAKPQANIALGAIILAQQAIGLVGESVILLTLPEGFGMLASSIVRFIAFDAAGFALMAAAFAWLVAQNRRSFPQNQDAKGASGR